MKRVYDYSYLNSKKPREEFYTFKISSSFLTDDNYIEKDVFERLSYDKKLILLNNIPDWKAVMTVKQLKECISMILVIWKYKYVSSRCNFDDYSAMCICALEIFDQGYCTESGFKKIQWCHKIQNSISDEYVRRGWRVSFGMHDCSDRYFYKNEKIRQQKIITFLKS